MGPSLTTARYPAGPVRRVPALRPATPAPGGRAASGAPGPAPATAAPATAAPAGTEAGPTAPAQRTAAPGRSRAPLGAPLGELPSTATPLTEGPAPRTAPGTGPAPGPALPVVQRRAEGATGTPDPYDGGAKEAARDVPQGPAAPADVPRRSPGPGRRTGARARGGLGEPLPALPPSAGLPGSTAPGARASRAASGSDDPHRERTAGAAPVPPAAEGGRTPAGAAPRTAPAPRAPGGGGADAPLLGTGDVQRRLAGHSSTAAPVEPGPALHGDGPATPLVAPSPAAPPHRPALENAAGAPGGSSATGRPGTSDTPGTAGAADPAGSARRHGTVPGGPGPGGPRPHSPAARVPVVLARAAAGGTGGAGIARTSGADGPRPLTVARSGGRSAPQEPRILSLLAARRLSLNTRIPEGVAPPAPPRSGDRPVVAVRRAGAPVAGQDGLGAPTARPVPVPPAAAPAGARGTGSPDAVQRVPVVRPAPPRPEAPAEAAAPPARSLPVAAPQTSAPALPVSTSGPAAPPEPAGAVPVVRWRAAPPGPRPAAAGGTGRAAAPVQRAATGTGGAAAGAGAPAGAARTRGRPRPASAPSWSPASAASDVDAAGHAGTPQDPGLDLDDLARRLLDPVARLLRTELRRGRERMGRPHDGRR
ncbi:hypothetical protein [Streptomyces sp. enrichment culture]|uniref:hypothetical protein n=1 Tax=Streptomyces sp. enrichment culture TaxID=1795815 RepID=UPI003F55E88F